ncbi:MAG TPA: tetratricopeptide repeat protein, partial [Blastocatellia bacterium]
MSEKEKILVRYLLGDLAEDSKRRVEEEYFENDDYHGQLLAVERDLIDRYVHEELSDKERKLFEKHFLSSPVRLQRVQFATALMKYCSTRRAGEKIGRSNSGRFRLSIAQTIFASKLRLAVAAVIVVGLGLGVWLAFFYQLGVDRGMAVLREVYRSNRPLQARVSMLDYARSAAERGGEPYIDDRRRRRAELIISEEVEDRPTPQAHHALGVVYLADRQFDQAIKEFQAALNDDPKNARLYSDLGVAFFEKGKLDRSKGESDLANKELTQSLEWLNKALSADGSLLEALFNIALLHQMILPHQAEEDWRRYLEKDSTSPWAEEARENLEQLQNSKRTSKSNEQILQEFLDSFRSGDEQRAWEISKRNREPISGRLIFWQLLESCLSLKANGRHDEAREKIDALAYAGNLESAKTGDNYVRDLAMLYQSASPKQLSLLWKAHDLMNKGHRQCSQSKYKDAIILYDLSGRAFEEAGSRWEARYADYWTGYCLLQSAQKEKALSMLENLSATFEKQGYLWLSALSFNS